MICTFYGIALPQKATNDTFTATLALKAIALARLHKRAEAVNTTQRAYTVLHSSASEFAFEAVIAAFNELGLRCRASDTLAIAWKAGKRSMHELVAHLLATQQPEHALSYAQASAAKPPSYEAVAEWSIAALLSNNVSLIEENLPSTSLGVASASDLSHSFRSLESQMLEVLRRPIEAAAALGDDGSLNSWQERRRARLLSEGGHFADALTACTRALSAEPGDLVAAFHATQLCLDHQLDDADSVIEQYTANGMAKLLSLVHCMSQRLARKHEKSSVESLCQLIRTAFHQLASHCSSFATDIAPYVASLRREDPDSAFQLGQDLFTDIESVPLIAIDNKGYDISEQPSSIGFNELRNVRFLCIGNAVARMLQCKKQKSLSASREEACRLMQLYRRSKSLWTTTKDIREPSVADGFVLMAADEMLSYVRSCYSDQTSPTTSLLLEAAAALEEGLLESPHHPWMHIQLLHIYSLLGSSAHFDTAFDRLDIKNFLLESMSQHFTECAQASADTARMYRLASSVLRFHNEHADATPESIRTAFFWGNYSKAAEFARFSHRLRSSHLLQQCRIELATQEIFSLSAPSASSLSSSQHELQYGFLLLGKQDERDFESVDSVQLAFNHDFTTRPHWAPPPLGCPSLSAHEWWRSCRDESLQSKLWWESWRNESQTAIPEAYQNGWTLSLQRAWLNASAAAAMCQSDIETLHDCCTRLKHVSEQFSAESESNAKLVHASYHLVRVASHLFQHLAEHVYQHTQTAPRSNDARSDEANDGTSLSILLKDALPSFVNTLNDAGSTAASSMIVLMDSDAQAEHGSKKKFVKSFEVGFGYRFAYEVIGVLNILAQLCALKMKGSTKSAMKAESLNLQLAEVFRSSAAAVDAVDNACQAAPVGNAKKCANLLAPPSGEWSTDEWVTDEQLQFARRKAADGFASSLASISKLALSRAKSLRDAANALSKA